MRALTRLAAIAVAGATLYYAGIVNAIVIQRPSGFGATIVVVAVAAALVLLVASLRGTGRGDAQSAEPLAGMRLWTARGAWAFISVMALVSLAWLFTVPRAHSSDATPYHNDAIALNECAARLVLRGENPYVALDVFSCYEQLGIGPDRTTPLRDGAFRDVAVYPSDDQLEAAWAAADRTVPSEEFVWRPSYPALSFVLLAPWVWLGWDGNLLYLLCLLAAMALVVLRGPASLRPWTLTALLGATSLTAFTVGGSADLLYALPLVAAWLWRERRWSGLALGVACAVKQLAWFLAPFYVLQVAAVHGPREAARRAGLAAAVFAAANLPFIVADPGAWAAGVATPVMGSMFPRGAGLVFLSTNGVLPLLPGAAYLALEGVAAAAVLVVAWRTRRTDPELGVVLGMLPLFFAYRSLFSYFFLLPLFALAAVVRMPLGALRPHVPRAAGALTFFVGRRTAARDRAE